nr:replication protein A 70 kDa DNA-binding subunit D-like [Ipomoea batatas]GME19470.1 replication protein A 70 kDa DNA-binding subunit D-like [Ipomoea batatas]
MYILARDVQTRNTTATMRLRTYDILQSRYSDKVKSRKCVFHDEEGSYVHFHILGNNVSVSNDFIEGHVYCIKNFLGYSTEMSNMGSACGKDEEAESPLPNALTQMANVGGNESEAVKRRLLDEFSSTQCPKKKTHTAIIKLEKDNQLGGDQNSKN